MKDSLGPLPIETQAELRGTLNWIIRGEIDPGLFTKEQAKHGKVTGLPQGLGLRTGRGRHCSLGKRGESCSQKSERTWANLTQTKVGRRSLI